MIWEKLKEKKCPRCSKKLESSQPYAEEFRCSDSHCLFKIDERRFEEVVRSLYKRDDKKYVYDVEQNLEELNNLKI